MKVDIDRLFHALGDPTRRAMLDRLSRGPLSVSALAAPLGITVTAVAQHLQILEECGWRVPRSWAGSAPVVSIPPDSTHWNDGFAIAAPCGSTDSTAWARCSRKKTSNRPSEMKTGKSTRRTGANQNT